jgi:hypothetical protein
MSSDWNSICERAADAMDVTFDGVATIISGTGKKYRFEFKKKNFDSIFSDVLSAHYIPNTVTRGIHIMNSKSRRAIGCFSIENWYFYEPQNREWYPISYEEMLLYIVEGEAPLLNLAWVGLPGTADEFPPEELK